MSTRRVNKRKLTKFAVGDMRDRIEIFVRSVIAPGAGSASVTEEYVLLREIWSRLDHLIPGKVIFDEVDTGGQPTHIFTIRFWLDITTQNRVKFDNDYYKIVKVVDPQGRKEYLRLYCKLMGSFDRIANE
jgi:head-tail adaptor